MMKRIRNGLVALVALGLPLLPAASAAEIPPGVDHASRVQGKGDTSVEADALDPVERAELAKSDPSQKGGNVIVAVVVIAAIVVLVYVLVEHVDHH